MENDIATMGKFLAVGMATFGIGAAAIAVATIASSYLTGALRNPAAAAAQVPMLFVGIAFAEALGIFSFLVALLLLFAV